MPDWVPNNEELVLKALGSLPVNKWNTFASHKMQDIHPDLMPPELRNFRITAFNEVKASLNEKFSNNVKYFGGFFDNAEFDRFLKEITPRLINLAQDINAR